MNSSHYKVKPYKCRANDAVCKMAFAADSDRKRHERKVHKVRIKAQRKSMHRIDPPSSQNLTTVEAVEDDLEAEAGERIVQVQQQTIQDPLIVAVDDTSLVLQF